MDDADQGARLGEGRKSGRSAVFWWLLAAGMALRLVCLNQPIFNNNNLRQTQTATFTESIGAQKGLVLCGTVGWMGDLNARLVVEFPVYNYLVLGANKLIGHLDASAKLVSAILWALSFLLLQAIWHRFLDPKETFWANFLFVVAPLSVYFGQSFQPEMLIQFTSFSFLVLLLKYTEVPTLTNLAGVAVVGVLGMLIKAPEFSHLYILALLYIGQKEGLGALKRVRYWVAAALPLWPMWLWSRYIDQVNPVSFPEWASSRKMLGLLLGSWDARFRPFGYIPLGVYIVLFVTTIGGLFWVLLGLRELVTNRRNAFVLSWLGSLLFFYLFWAGETSRAHSYYNLPSLGLVCMGFGIGCARWLGDGWRMRHARAAGCLITVLTLGTAVGPYVFLFHNDPVLVHASAWLRDNTSPDDLILVCVNHRTDMSSYRHNSTIAYNSHRRIWPWLKSQEPDIKTRALATSRWALVTHPVNRVGLVEKLRRWVKESPPFVEDMSWLESKCGFKKYFETAEFTVYKRQS